MQLPNLTNYNEHPTEPEWLVFRFNSEQQARQFEEALQHGGLRHERDTEGGPPYLVAARRADREKAVRFNYVVLGQHRSPFIPHRGLRWAIFGVVAALIALALAGALLR